MIQRVQTVYLAIGALLLGLTSLFAGMSARLSAGPAWYEPAVMATMVLAAVGGLAAIFLYANRKRQRGVVVLVQVLTVIALAGVAAGSYFWQVLFAESVTWTGWLLLVNPAIAYILFWMARRGIDRDIALVRSMDRLR